MTSGKVLISSFGASSDKTWKGEGASDRVLPDWQGQGTGSRAQGAARLGRAPCAAEFTPVTDILITASRSDALLLAHAQRVLRRSLQSQN